jgi:hypothetical protein
LIGTFFSRKNSEIAAQYNSSALLVASITGVYNFLKILTDSKKRHADGNPLLLLNSQFIRHTSDANIWLKLRVRERRQHYFSTGKGFQKQYCEE